VEKRTEVFLNHRRFSFCKTAGKLKMTLKLTKESEMNTFA